MAGQVASRTMLQGIGFSLAAANAIYVAQGIGSIKKLATSDDDTISTLCKVLQQPGGALTGGGVDTSRNESETGHVLHRTSRQSNV